jgi:hypothetical protein
LVPLIATELMVKARVPLFVTVTTWPELVVPTVWPPKVMLVGERLTFGAAFSIAMMLPRRRMYSFEGVVGLAPWEKASEAVVRSSKAK